MIWNVCFFTGFRSFHWKKRRKVNQGVSYYRCQFPTRPMWKAVQGIWNSHVDKKTLSLMHRKWIALYKKAGKCCLCPWVVCIVNNRMSYDFPHTLLSQTTLVRKKKFIPIQYSYYNIMTLLSHCLFYGSIHFYCIEFSPETSQLYGKTCGNAVSSVFVVFSTGLFSFHCI